MFFLFFHLLGIICLFRSSYVTSGITVTYERLLAESVFMLCEGRLRSAHFFFN